jgi:hypothetical protein
MSSSQLDVLVGACQRCTRDEKLEIRGLAAATLGGLIKVLQEGSASNLRKNMLEDAARVFPRRHSKSGTKASAVMQHASVLNLVALLHSSPYHILEWYAPR